MFGDNYSPFSPGFSDQSLLVRAQNFSGSLEGEQIKTEFNLKYVHLSKRGTYDVLEWLRNLEKKVTEQDQPLPNL